MIKCIIIHIFTQTPSTFMYHHGIVTGRKITMINVGLVLIENMICPINCSMIVMLLILIC